MSQDPNSNQTPADSGVSPPDALPPASLDAVKQLFNSGKTPAEVRALGAEWAALVDQCQQVSTPAGAGCSAVPVRLVTED